MTSRAIIIAAVLHGALIAAAFYYIHERRPVAGPGTVLAALQSETPNEAEKLAEQPLDIPPAPREMPAPELNVQPLEEIPEPVVEPPLPEPPQALQIAPERAPRRLNPPLVIARPARNPPITPPAEPPAAPRSHCASGGAGGENTPPALTGWEPPLNVRAHFRGRVVAVIAIDAAGKVTTVSLDKGTGRRDWDEALLRALKAGTYRAAREDGREVASSLRQPILFE